MEKTDYPGITRYRYHFMAIYYASSDLSLTASGESIIKTVPPTHPELPILLEAGRQRREELRPKRILFCGSRDWANVELIVEQLKRFRPSYTTIVHGAGRGADTIAAMEAEKFHFKIEAFPADWDNLGKAAGPARNLKMIQSGIDEVIAFGLSKSRGGTRNTVELAQAREIKVTVVEED